MSSTDLKPPSESEIRFNEVLITKLKTFSSKNTDYGDSYKVDGIVGIIIRLGDKLMRLKTTSKDGHVLQVKEEGLQELLLDISNYADMGLMLLKEKVDAEADCGCDKSQFIQQGENDTSRAICQCRTDTFTGQ